MTYDLRGRWEVCVFLMAQVTHCFHLLNQLHTPPVQEYVKNQKPNPRLSGCATIAAEVNQLAALVKL